MNEEAKRVPDTLSRSTIPARHLFCISTSPFFLFSYVLNLLLFLMTSNTQRHPI